MEDKPKNNKLSVELPEDIAEGTYANLAIISHSSSEFVLDFVRVLPNLPKAKVKSRVVMTPLQTKRLLKALGDNVNKYEAQHGVITGKESAALPPMSFNTPKAQA